MGKNKANKSKIKLHKKRNTKVMSHQCNPVPVISNQPSELFIIPTIPPLEINKNHIHSVSSQITLSSLEHNELTKTLTNIATSIWRIKEKLKQYDLASLPSDLKLLPRHVQAAWDALINGDIEIIDFAGERYVAGMAVTPIAFQPMEGCTTESICETIKPTIYYKGKLVQRADVIIACPIEADKSSQSCVDFKASDHAN
jgi:hypothetical protein